MGRMVIGIVLATIAMYLWGFVYWGILGLPQKNAWKETADDRAAQSALRSHFPEDGTYYVPSHNRSVEELTEMYERGPVAMVHMTGVDGRSPHAADPMWKGFLLYLVTCTVMALLVRKANPSSYVTALQITILGGAACALLVDMGDVVWWWMALDWKLYEAVYTLSAWVVAGLILAKFARPKPATK